MGIIYIIVAHTNCDFKYGGVLHKMRKIKNIAIKNNQNQCSNSLRAIENQLTSNMEEESEEFDSNQQKSDILESGSITTLKAKHVIHVLTIVGQIEGHYILPPQNKTTKYEHVIPQLVAIEQDASIEGLMIILNTVGGDVEAGLAIAELIAGMKKPTVSLVLGGGHSIGVPLACSARQSFITSSATMTVHPVRMNGLVLGVPQTLSYFDKMQERIVRFVVDNSNVDSDGFRKLMMNTEELVMDVGTVLDGEKAVKAGLIDHLGGLSEAIECLYSMIEEEHPEEIEDECDCECECECESESEGDGEAPAETKSECTCKNKTERKSK